MHSEKPRVPAVSACGPAQSSQKSLLPSVKKRNRGKPAEILLLP